MAAPSMLGLQSANWKGVFFHAENFQSVNSIFGLFIFQEGQAGYNSIYKIPNKTKALTGDGFNRHGHATSRNLSFFFRIVSFLNMILSSIWSWDDVDVTLNHFLHVFDKLKRSGRVNRSTHHPHHHYSYHHLHYHIWRHKLLLSQTEKTWTFV